MAAYLLFFFVAFGAKLVLAAIMIYLLLPTDPRCSRCDGETLLLQMGAVGRAVSRLLLGTVQRRWCPRCGWEGMGRASRPAAPGRRTRIHVQTPVRPRDGQ